MLPGNESIDSWLAYLTCAGRGQATVRLYRNWMDRFMRFALGRNRSVLQVTSEDAWAWIAYLQKRQLAPATISSKLAVIRGFYRWAADEGLISENPTRRIPSPKVHAPLPRALPREKLLALLHAPWEHSVKGCRDRAVLQTMFECGLRRSEVCGLRLRDLELDTGRVWIARGKGGKPRLVALGPAGKEIIRKWLDVRAELLPTHDWLFLETHTMGQLGPGTVSLLCAAYLEGIGMEPTKYPSGHTRSLGSHSLRHTCGTELLQAGADLRTIQEYLGHERLETTARYTHVSEDRLMAAAGRMPVLR